MANFVANIILCLHFILLPLANAIRCYECGTVKKFKKKIFQIFIDFFCSIRGTKRAYTMREQVAAMASSAASKSAFMVRIF